MVAFHLRRAAPPDLGVLAHVLSVPPEALHAWLDAEGQAHFATLIGRLEAAQEELRGLAEADAPPASCIEETLAALLRRIRGNARQDPKAFGVFADWCSRTLPVVEPYLDQLPGLLEAPCRRLGLPDSAGWELVAATYPWTFPPAALAQLDQDPEPALRAAVRRRLASLLREAWARGEASGA